MTVFGMNAKQWVYAIAFGALMAFIITNISWITIFGVIGGLIIISRLLIIRRRRKEREWSRVFDLIYNGSSFTPELEITYSYGYPHFRVFFHSNEELSRGTESTFNEDFARAIEEYCNKDADFEKRPFRPFDARYGVSFAVRRS